MTNEQDSLGSSFITSFTMALLYPSKSTWRLLTASRSRPRKPYPKIAGH